MFDEYGALLPEFRAARRVLAAPRAAAAAGPLAGLDFVVKDVFDVAGHRTGAGNPEFLAEAKPAAHTAPAVAALIDAGATLVGKSITDEFTWSLAGTNPHYGTPRNPRAPDRAPGGSSSGSAVAVAAGLVPFALGTDTAGSVRVPASYTGIFGIRPTHGRVSTEGVVPLAPDYDTVGWFAATGELLARVGQVLLAPRSPAPPAPSRLVVLSDAFELADAEVRDALAGAVDRLTSALGLPQRDERFCADGRAGFERMAQAYPVLMSPQAWRIRGPWLRARPRRLGAGVGARFERASTITTEESDALLPVRAEAIARVRALTADGSVLVVPAAPTVAPKLDTPYDELVPLRARTLAAGIVATLTGAPSVSLPLAGTGGLPVNVALIGAPNSDEHLLNIGTRCI